MNRVVKKVLFVFSSFLTDLLNRRPYFDKEASRRGNAEDELLHLDLVITECCSLNCRDCSNLMQYYDHPCNLSSDEVINDLRKITGSLKIGELNILGGEPFVNQKVLSAVLAFLTEEKADRVDSINIITNGTIVPGEECINAMKNNPKTRHIPPVFQNQANKMLHLSVYNRYRYTKEPLSIHPDATTVYHNC